MPEDASRSLKSAPLREVRRIDEVKGPRGGTLHVMRLDCGHYLWQRRRPFLFRKLACMGCWIDAELKAIEPPVVVRILCERSCARCAGDYCDHHGIEPCDCDVIERHGQE